MTGMNIRSQLRILAAIVLGCTGLFTAAHASTCEDLFLPQDPIESVLTLLTKNLHSHSAADVRRDADLVDLAPGLQLFSLYSLYFRSSEPNQKEIEGSKVYASWLEARGKRLVLYSKHRDSDIPGFDGLVFEGGVPVANYSHKACSSKNITHNLHLAFDAAQNASRDSSWNRIEFSERIGVQNVFGFNRKSGKSIQRKLHVVITVNDQQLNSVLSRSLIDAIQWRMMKPGNENVEQVIMTHGSSMVIITRDSVRRG